MSEILFDKTLICRFADAGDRREVLSGMVDHLQKKGIVKDTYKNAILEREKNFPTGLYTGEINVAIPHADVKHVNQAAICVGVLEKPVKFCRMEEPDEEIDVHVVIMLSLTEAHGHIDMLQKVIALIQDQEALANALAADDEAIAKMIADALL